LKQAVESVASPEGISVDVKIRQGVPYREIVQEAEDGEYDLIVLGARGKSRLKEFLYGSNAEKVVRRAHCSVYLVKTPCELS
jgi:nucleotide-binding universal stress UspA family protein